MRIMLHSRDVSDVDLERLVLPRNFYDGMFYLTHPGINRHIDETNKDKTYILIGQLHPFYCSLLC